MKNLLLTILLIYSIALSGQSRYIEYNSFDAAKVKLDYISKIHFNGEKQLDIIHTDSTGTKFYVILDLIRASGCDNCYTQQDIESAKIVEELLDFPNNEPDKLYQVVCLKDSMFRLIQDIPTYPQYSHDLGVIPYYFGDYILMYFDQFQPADEVVLKRYFGENCIRNNQNN